MSKLPIIRGFNEVSEAGVRPNKTKIYGPSIFLGGCNLLCPYCMNSKLIVPQDSKESKEVDIEKVKAYVKKDEPEMLFISGGEPTCTPIESLKALIKEIKSWGVEVGLSTNGTNMDSLASVIGDLSYVALDIKTILSKYHLVTNAERSKLAYTHDLLRCLSLCAMNKQDRKDFAYEVRTTLYPPLVGKHEIEVIGGTYLFKDTMWILQQFRRVKNMPDVNANNIDCYTDEQVRELLKLAREYVRDTFVRFV